MNEKVTQMVSLLFKDVALSDEVQALREEVLNNCQDRFDDLIHSGLSEEESLAAVMESLKGMDEVLKDYPRAGAETEEAVREPAPEEKGPSLTHFNPEDIRALDFQVAGCDIEVRALDGGCSLEITGNARMNLEKDGTLRIWQEKLPVNPLEGISWENSLDSFEHFSDALNQLGRNLGNLFSKGLNLNQDDCRAVIGLPRGSRPDARIRTMSGNIRWEGLTPGRVFSLKTTSGDVKVWASPADPIPEADISTMSGDAEIRLNAEKAKISSVSGDIAWEGSAGRLEMNTTSGDGDMTGTIREIRMNTTSGDLNIELKDVREADIRVNSISGDIDLRLPSGVREIDARLKSVSGDISRRDVEIRAGAPIRVEAATVSGDLIIRH